MKQLVQSTRSGALRFVDVPTPVIGPSEVLVSTSRSLISAGTEKAVRRLASAGLVAKARARPDLVRQVIKKARNDGLVATAQNVRSRLDEEMPLGYSAAGTVAAVGEGVAGIRPGDRVATGGAGHAELQVVAGLLAARIPDGVSDEEAAFGTVGSIALHALRLAEVGPGARIAVVGLGLVGQLAARIARSAGCEVVGIDVRPWSVSRAQDVSVDLALHDEGEDTTAAVIDWSEGLGVDAVLLTAATPSSGPARRAPDLARDRANIVVVGDIGLDLDRRPLYEKELSIKVARSYGPGRYERTYEDWAVDYPPAHVRWTEGRNIAAVLGLIARRRLQVADLVTHRFPFDEALSAYELLDSSSEHLAVQFAYGALSQERSLARPVNFHPRIGSGCGIGLLGAGNFARSTLVPALRSAGFNRFVAVASASGLSAVRLAERAGFERAVSDATDVIDDPEVGLVVVATPHNTHAELVARALKSGKHVFCEKPLALSDEDLDRVESAWEDGGAQLWVGFNRRYSPSVLELTQRFAARSSPLVTNYRINAGPVPKEHWYADRRQGGRLLGEVCHFIDAATAITGSPVTSARGMSSGRDEPLLDPDFVVCLRHADGSLTTIAYASGAHASTPKEHIQVMGGGHTAIVDDFRSATFDGTTVWKGSTDKGHVGLLTAMRESIEQLPNAPTASFIASARATIWTATSLLSDVAGGPSDG